jgi:hypothetical protein
MKINYMPFIGDRATYLHSEEIPDAWFKQIQNCGCGEKIYRLLSFNTVPIMKEKLAYLEAKELHIPFIEFEFKTLRYYFLWKVPSEYHKIFNVPGKMKLSTDLIDEIVIQYDER